MSRIDADWLASYNAIRTANDLVFETIDKAVRCEESEQPPLALANYKLSVVLIDEALATPVGLPDHDVVELDETWDHAIQMIQKMQRTRIELTQRIGQLTVSEQRRNHVQPASSATDAAATDRPSTTRPWTHTELAQALLEPTPPDVQLIYTCSDVQLYNIAANGDVSTSPESSVLRILCMTANAQQNMHETYFMQILAESLSAVPSPTLADCSIVDGIEIGNEVTAPVGAVTATRFDRPWIYPLVAGVSPCYYTKFGAFVFPDLYADGATDASVGIVVEGDSNAILLEVLEAILQDVVREKRDEEPDDADEEQAGRPRLPRSASEQVSDGIVAGASYISRGLVYGSTKMGEFVERNTPYIMSKMTPGAQTAPVSRGMVSGMEVAKTATGVAASVTGYVADKLGTATMALGRYLAPHVQTKGTQLLSHTMGYSAEEAADKMSGVMIVAAGAVEGFGTVYSGLEQSASLLGNSLGNNTVRVIEHRYGSTAGELASETFDTVGNMINISQNMSILKPTTLAKKTAKNAGKAMIQSYRPAAGRSMMPASELVPELSKFSRAIAERKRQ